MDKPDEMVKRFEARQKHKQKLVSLHKTREQKQEERQRKNRLMMLMHSFLDAEAKGDEDAKRMFGRGISGYTREERQEAYVCALNARKATTPDVPTADDPTDNVVQLRPAGDKPA